MSGAYNTRQKEIILSFLRSTPDASFTASEIFRVLKASGAPVGLTTVYRQLEGLCDDGRVREIITSGGKGTRFQYLGTTAKTDAFFLKCERCGKMEGADCALLSKVVRHMAEEHGFRINTEKTVIYGLCINCK